MLVPAEQVFSEPGASAGAERSSRNMANHSLLHRCDMGSFGKNKPQHRLLDMHHMDMWLK